MATFEKETLYPTTVHAYNPKTRERVTVTYSAAEVKHLNNRLRDMVQCGLQIPVGWEHQAIAKPKTQDEWGDFLAEKTKKICGYVTGSDLKPGTKLFTKLDVPDPEDARRVRVIKFTSPEIVRDFVDGTGRLWPGLSITHLAITPRPVLYRQDPIRELQLSLNHPRMLRLSLGDQNMAEYDDDEDKDLFGDDEDEEAATPPDGDGDADTDDFVDDEDPPAPEADTPPTVDPAAPTTPETPAVDPKAQQMMDLLRQDFQKVGIDLTPAISPGDELAHIHTAVLTLISNMQQQQQPGMGDDGLPGSDEYSQGNPLGGDGQVKEVPPQVVMSLQAENANLKKTTSGLMTRLLAIERNKLKKRNDRLKAQGKIGTQKHQQHQQEIAMAHLSLGADGQLENCPILVKIAEAETNDIPAKKLKTKSGSTSQLSHAGYPNADVQEVEQPWNSKKTGTNKVNTEVVNIYTRGAYSRLNGGTNGKK